MSTRIIQLPRPVSRPQVQDPGKIPKPRKPADAQTLTAEQLREILHYDKETGTFTRKVSTSSRAKVGDAAGRQNGDGYLQIMVQSRDYLAHRLAWLYVHSEWPKDQLDHINRIRTDNRMANLREVTNKQNHQNRSKSSNNTSGYPGVYWNKQNSKWVAKIRHNQKQIHLGYFTDIEDAIAARKAGELKYWGHHRAD